MAEYHHGHDHNNDNSYPSHNCAYQCVPLHTVDEGEEEDDDSSSDRGSGSSSRPLVVALQKKKVTEMIPIMLSSSSSSLRTAAQTSINKAVLV